MPFGRLGTIIENIRELRPTSIPHREEEIVDELVEAVPEIVDELVEAVPEIVDPTAPPPVNQPPIIISFDGDSYETVVGGSLSFTTVAYDPDGNNNALQHDYTVEAGTHDDITVGIDDDGNSQSTIEWTAPLTIPEEEVTYLINVTVTDEEGASVSGTPLSIVVRRVCNPPDKPEAPTVTSQSVSDPVRELSVRWVDPPDNGCPIFDYDLRYHKGDGIWQMWLESETNWLPVAPDPDSYIATVGMLEPDTEYHFQVRAENSSGDGEWSNSGVGSTDPVNQPPELTLTADPPVIARSGSNNLPRRSTITATATDPEGEFLTYVFTILRFGVDIGDTGLTTTADDDGALIVNVRMFTFPPATENIDYDVQCTVSDTHGNSTIRFVPVRVIDVPEVPSGLTCMAGETQSVTVGWGTPTHTDSNNSAIFDYDMRRKQSNEGPEGWVMVDGLDVDGLDRFTGLSTSVEGLDETQNYDFQVRAENEAGESDWSDTVSCLPGMPPNTCPFVIFLTAETGNSATSFGSPVFGNVIMNRRQFVLLTLNATDPDGDPLFYDFEVESITPPPPDLTDQGWSFTAAPNPNSNQIVFQPADRPATYVIRARVSDGDDDCDVFIDRSINVINIAPVVSIAIDESDIHIGGSTTATATVSDFEGDTTTILWEVLDSNGMVITDGSGGTLTDVVSITTDYEAPTMNSQAGTYTLRATVTDFYNATATDMADVVVTVDIQPPGTVPIRSVEATIDVYDELNVTWNAPMDDGGLPVLSYQIGYRLTDGMDLIQTMIPANGERRMEDDLEHWDESTILSEIYTVTTMTSYPVTEDIDGLLAGRQYDFRVRARNASTINSGFGEWSDYITQEVNEEFTVELMPDDSTIFKGEVVILTARASRTQNITYDFTELHGGTFAIPNSPNVREWTAPDKSTLYQEQVNSAVNPYEVIVIATDTTTMETARGMAHIMVFNRAPVIDLFQSPGLSFSTPTPNVVTGNTELQFSVAVSDPDFVDANNLVIEWSHLVGSGVSRNNGLSYAWTLPPNAGVYNLTVAVSDGDYIRDTGNNIVLAQDTRTIAITVNSLPTVTVTSPVTNADPGDQTTITAVIVDPDGSTIDDNQVVWSVVRPDGQPLDAGEGGNFIGSQTVVSNGTYTRVWEAPAHRGTKRITVTYRDFFQGTNFQEVSGFVDISVSNRAPQLQISGDDNVATGQNLTLIARPLAGMPTIDPDGDPVIYLWEIVSGPGRIFSLGGQTVHDPPLSPRHTSSGDFGSPLPPNTIISFFPDLVIYVPPSPPDAPAEPTVEHVAGESDALQVTWIAPDDNGIDITDYDIRYKKTSDENDSYIGVSFTGAGLTHKIQGLDNDTSYDVQIRASNDIGTTDWSENGTGTTLNAPPVIQSFVATPPQSASGGQVTLIVHATDAGLQPTDLTYAFTIINDPEDNSFGFLTDGMHPNQQVYNAPTTPGTYDVMVTVSDNHATPSSATATLSIEVVNLPDKIVGITVTQGVNDTSISIPRSILNVTWIAPNENGSPIIGYHLQYRQMGRSIANTMRLTTTMADLTRLRPDTDYEIRVRAQNSTPIGFGYGEWSDYVVGHTADDISDTPVITSVVAPQSQHGTLQVTWIVADDNGSAITDYDIQYRILVPPGEPVNTWDEWKIGETISSSPESVTGLVSTTATTYEFQVRATNGVGTTDWSRIGIGTTEDFNAPPTIISFTADEYTISAIVHPVLPEESNLTVVATDDNTDPDDLIYTFSIVGDTLTDDRGSFRAHDSGDVNKIVYVPPDTAGIYTVMVVVSDEDMGSTQPTAMIDITVINVPDAPLAPRLIPSTTDFREMVVKWDPPFNHFSSIIDYDVRHKTSEDDESGYASQTSTAQMTTLIDLLPATTYNVQVRAANAVGESEWSDVSTETTGRIPLRIIGVTANPMSISDGARSTITVEAQGQNLMYDYDVPTGHGTLLFAPEPYQHIYVAPDTSGSYIVSVQVTDGVSTVSGSVTINVGVNTTPEKVLKPQTWREGGTSHVSWLEPYDRGSPILRYQVRTLLGNNSVTGRTFSTTDEFPQIFDVRALNINGAGEYSEESATDDVSSDVSSGSRATANIINIRSTEVSGETRYNLRFNINLARRVDAEIINEYRVGIKRATDNRYNDWTFEVHNVNESITNQSIFSDLSVLAPDIEFESGVRYTVGIVAYHSNLWTSSWDFIDFIPVAPGTSPPDAPDTPTVTERDDNTELLVHWLEPQQGDSIITHYQIQYRTSLSRYILLPENINQPTDTSLGISHVLPNLSPGTTYQVQVRAVNSYGNSDWSEPPGQESTSGTSTPITAPLPPIISSITAPFGMAGTLRVTWIKPPVDDDPMTDDDITDYDVEYKLVDASVNDYVEVTGDDDFTDTTTDITGLMSGEMYHVHVQAANSVGESGYGPAVIGTTSAVITVPDPPENLVVNQHIENTKLNVSWQVPNLFGGIVLDYDIRYRRTGTSSWAIWNESDTEFTNTSDEIENLTANRQYDVQVRVRSNSQQDIGNGVGVSNWSSTVEGTTGTVTVDPIAPSPPSITSPSADDTVSDSPNSVDIEWSTPNLNGSTLVGYFIEYRRANDNAWIEYNIRAITENTATITSTMPMLSANTRYAFRVKARGEVDLNNLDSNWSSIRYVYTALRIPPPSAPVITVTDTTTRSISITWTMPPASGGHNVDSYTVEYRIADAGSYLPYYTGTNRAITIDDLREGTDYDIRVTAYIGTIAGTPAEITQSTDTGNSAPVIHQFTSSSSQITLGAQVTYTVRATDIDSDPLSYTPRIATFNGSELDSMTDYGDFELLGIDSNGRASYSFIPTLAGVYRIEISVSDGALTTTSNRLRLNVRTSANINPTVTVTGPDRVLTGTTPEFIVTVDDPDTNSTWLGTWSVNSGSVSPTTDSGDRTDMMGTTTFTPSTMVGEVTIRFDAIDDRMGTGFDTHEFEVVAATTAPDRVRGVEASPTSGSHISLDVSWDVPYDGGSAITEYVVTYENLDTLTEDTETVTAPNGIPSNTMLMMLTQGTPYSITVAARNSVGLGEASSAATVETTEPNTAPMVTLSVNSVIRTTYRAGQLSEIDLNANASDSEDALADLTYSWEKSGGEFQQTISDNRPNRVWIAPGTAGFYTIEVTVSDTGGLKAEASVVIEITGSGPIIESMTNGRKVCPGAEQIINAFATDPDPGDTIEYDWSDTINGVVSNNGRTLTWTAPQESGEYPITVTVTDSDDNSTSRTEVFVVNSLPTVTIRSDDSKVVAGETTTITVSITDLDDDPTSLRHNWDANIRGSWDGPATLVTSTSTQAQYTRVWRAPTGQGGSLVVGFSATDSCESGAANVTIEIGGGRPTVSLLPTISNLVLTRPIPQEEDFTATGMDPEGGILTYSWSITGTAGGTLDNSVGIRVVYRPTAVGIDTLTVVATDPEELTDTASATIRVTAPMVRPTITELNAGSTTLDPLASTIIECITPDTNAEVLWEVTAGRGELSDGETDLTQVLTVDNNVRARSQITVKCTLMNVYGMVSETVTITVNNVAPQITGSSGVPESIPIGRVFRPSVTWVDLNGDRITYRWSSTTFNIQNATSARPTITAPMDVGPAVLTCTIEDVVIFPTIDLTDSIDFTINVTEPPPNESPIVTIRGTTRIFENQTTILTASATDPENDSIVSYVWDVTSGTGAVSIPDNTPANNNVTTFRPDGFGDSVVTCVVTDFEGSVGSADVTIEVLETAEPVITELTGDTTLDPLEPTTIECVTSSIYTSVRWSVAGRGDLSDGTTDLEQVLTVDNNVRARSQITVTCTLTNQHGSTSDTITITVNNVAPEITGSDGVPEFIQIGDTFVPSITWVDLNGDSVRYTWSAINLSISNATSARPTITADTEPLTAFLTCTIQDLPPSPLIGLTDSIDFTVTVTLLPPNNPPSVIIDGPDRVHQQSTARLRAIGSDFDGIGDITGYVWEIPPGDEGTLDPLTGTRVTFTPESDNLGTTTVECTVTDRSGETGFDYHEIEVFNNRPVIERIDGDERITPLDTARLTVTGSDPDGSSDIAGYEWFVSPSEGTLNTLTGTRVTFTPDSSFSGSATVECTITDRGGLTGSAIHSILVTNEPPEDVEITGPVMGFTTQFADLRVTATDPDGASDIASYEWEIRSGGGTLSPMTGTTTRYRPLSGGTGLKVIRCTVTDRGGLFDFDDHEITVTIRPAFTGRISPQAIGQGGSFTVTASNVANVDYFEVTVDDDSDRYVSITQTSTLVWTVDTDDDIPEGTIITVRLEGFNAGGSSARVQAVTVGMVSPSVIITGPDRVHQQSTASLRARGSDPQGSSNIAGYAWDVISGGGTVSPMTGTRVTFTPESDNLGTSEIECIITDRDDHTGDDTFEIEVFNNPPVIERIDGDELVHVDDTVRLTATGSDPDGSRDIAGYEWFVNSGSGDVDPSTGRSTTFTPDREDVTEIECVITDRSGLTGNGFHTIQVTDNYPPTVTIRGRSRIHVLSPQLLTTTVRDRDGDRITDYFWFTNDGELSSETDSNTTFTPDRLGDAVIECTVTDARGATGDDTYEIEVFNNPPVLERITGPTNIRPTQTARLTATGSDPDGSRDIAGYEWFVNSGSGDVDPSTGRRTTFTPDGEDVTEIECVITDRWGDTGFDTHTISTENDPPEVEILGPDGIFSNQFADLTARATDPNGSGDIAGYEWETDLAEGRLSRTTGTTTRYRPIGTGTKVIECTVTDRGGLTGYDDHEIIVTARPTFDIRVTPTTVNPGDPFTLTILFANNIDYFEVETNEDAYAFITQVSEFIYRFDTERAIPVGTNIEAIVIGYNEGGSLRMTRTVRVRRPSRPSITLTAPFNNIGIGGLFILNAAHSANADEVTVEISPDDDIREINLYDESDTSKDWQVVTSDSIPFGTRLTCTATATNAGGSDDDEVIIRVSRR